MKKDALQGAEKYKKARQRKKRWYRVVTCLACVVVFCTVYALILPAITMEKKEACEIPEHTHSEACYTQVTTVARTKPVCTVESLNLHQHDSSCFDENGNLWCGYADFVVHRHDAACYDENGNLWCPLAEIETHEHTESCYAVPETEVPEVHTHTDGCYTLERGELICTEHVHTDACYAQITTLICGLEESDGHQHDESCQDEGFQDEEFQDDSFQDEAGELVCGLEASEGHHHDSGCYETNWERVCGFEGDHQHSDGCYAWNRVLTCNLPTESEWVEPEPVLVCGKSEILLHEHTANCLDESGRLICGKIQVLEHQHTDACFETVEEPLDTAALTCTLPEDENHTHGPLCYGTWELTCGLEEHRHSEACMPTEQEQEAAQEPESEQEPKPEAAEQEQEPVYICGLEEHTHSEECYDEAGGLICGLEEHTHSEACQSTEEEADTQAEVPVLTASGEDYTVSVMPGFEAELPENTELIVTEIQEGSEEYETYFMQAETALQNAGATDPLVLARFFDLQLISDGEPVEPAAPVSVSITYTDMEGLESADCHAVHFTAEDVELLDAEVTENEDGSVCVSHTQSSFSVVGDVVTQAEDYSISAYANAPITGLDHNVTFMVKIRDKWVNVGSCTYDYSTAVNDRSASVSEKVLHQYFDNYGYSKESNPASTLKCSYDDIYTINYAQNGNATNFALDITNADIKEGTFLQLWTANQSPAQTFRIWRVVDNYYFITPLSNSSLHVNLQNGATDNGTRLWLHSALDEASWWGIKNNGDGTVSFYSQKKNSAYIDVTANNQSNGTVIALYEGGEANRWKPAQKYDEQAVVTSNGRVGLTAESNGNIVCFYTPSTPLNDPNAIYTAEELSKLGTSGSYYLGCDITVDHVNGSAADIGDGVSTTLDLNGHTIHYNVPAAESESSMVYLHGTGSLTITDSGQAVETTEVVTDRPLYGNLANYDSSTKTLIYYVTESRPKVDGTTTETLVKHTVDLTNVGAVESDTAPYHLIYVANNAVLNIQGGRYTNANGKRAITAYDNSSVNISGGYLCGCMNYRNGIVGGAVHVNSTGALNISGGVIAANRADKAGGVYKNYGTFSMTGGVITGNQVPQNANNGTDGTDCRGGGVQVDNAATTISGGYVTNNRLDYKCDAIGNGCHFGGGITQYSGTMAVTVNCFVTGNYSAEAGGGIGFSGDQFIMTGGTVAANVAQTAEGGGIRIQSSEQTSLISGGYITNNCTNSMHDWGGGGIFLVQNNSLQILNAVFQKNTADGFGGGVGGCSTGQIVAVDNTVGDVAIFDNYANGETMSGRHFCKAARQKAAAVTALRQWKI